MVKAAPPPGGRLHFLYGKEEFLRNEALRELKQHYFGASSPGADFQEFRSKEHRFAEALDFLQTSPFLSPCRMAHWRDIDRLPESDRPLVLQWIDHPAPTAVLILSSEESQVKRGAFLSGVADRAVKVPCYLPFERDLPGWIVQRAKRLGQGVEEGTVSALLERTGRDAASIVRALETLALYIHPRTVLRPQDVESLLGTSMDSDVYAMTDALMDRNARRAYRILAALSRDGVKAFEIVAQLGSQFEKIFRVRELLDQRQSGPEIMTRLGLKSFAYAQISKQAMKTVSARGREIRKALYRCDEAIKTGRTPEDKALDALILGICGS